MTAISNPYPTQLNQLLTPDIGNQHPNQGQQYGLNILPKGLNHADHKFLTKSGY
ncbi:MAG: hypothetical protein V7L14_31880 [Nostoc sp.]|uniref:hypothetical protein n=1 Tax=unclassified Nostoc TaxID=2593658 RepID=UPI0025D676F9|nr:hypothetical protein [Nostoc sp. NOS(2021)]MBN3898772.1 hypothetical protein [Nostoc sp. NOS(2021)]